MAGSLILQSIASKTALCTKCCHVEILKYQCFRLVGFGSCRCFSSRGQKSVLIALFCAIYVFRSKKCCDNCVFVYRAKEGLQKNTIVSYIADCWIHPGEELDRKRSVTFWQGNLVCLCFARCRQVLLRSGVNNKLFFQRFTVTVFQSFWCSKRLKEQFLQSNHGSALTSAVFWYRSRSLELAWQIRCENSNQQKQQKPLIWQTFMWSESDPGVINPWSWFQNGPRDGHGHLPAIISAQKGIIFDNTFLLVWTNTFCGAHSCWYSGGLWFCPHDKLLLYKKTRRSAEHIPCSSSSSSSSSSSLIVVAIVVIIAILLSRFSWDDLRPFNSSANILQLVIPDMQQSKGLVMQQNWVLRE